MRNILLNYVYLQIIICKLRTLIYWNMLCIIERCNILALCVLAKNILEILKQSLQNFWKIFKESLLDTDSEH